MTDCNSISSACFRNLIMAPLEALIYYTLLFYKRFHLSYYLNLSHRIIDTTILIVDLRNHKLPYKNLLPLSVQCRCPALQRQKNPKNLQPFLKDLI